MSHRDHQDSTGLEDQRCFENAFARPVPLSRRLLLIQRIRRVCRSGPSSFRRRWADRYKQMRSLQSDRRQDTLSYREDAEAAAGSHTRPDPAKRCLSLSITQLALDTQKSIAKRLPATLLAIDRVYTTSSTDRW